MKSPFGVWSLSLMLSSSYSCTLDCGDGENLSPEELIEFCDLVATSRCVAIDTLMNLGRVNYLGDEAKFFVMQYVFQPQEILMGKNDVKNIYLWKCDHIRIRDNYSTTDKLDSSKAVLAFGKILNPNDEMTNIMSNMANMYFLKELRKGRSFDEIVEVFFGNELLRKQAGFVSFVPRNTYKADTSIAAFIDRKQEVLGSMVKQRQQDGIVIYGIDELTFSSFEYGVLCYYDQEGWPRTKFSQEYLEELRSIIKRYNH